MRFNNLQVNERDKSESICSSPPGAISTGSQINLEEKDDTEPESKETATDDKPKEEELPPSPANIKENILQKFLVEMPEDFYSFWEFCCSLNKENPEGNLTKIVFLSMIISIINSHIFRCVTYFTWPKTCWSI